MGAVLTQNGHPISYFSEKFCPKLLNYFTYVRELHTITAAVNKRRHYLLGQFIIETDQDSLKKLMNQVIQTPDQHYYLSKLLGYDYIVLYKPEKSNIVANALSRRDHHNNNHFFLLTTSSFDFLITLLTKNQTLSDLKTLNAEIAKQPLAHQSMALLNGILHFQGKPFLRRDSLLKFCFAGFSFHSYRWSCWDFENTLQIGKQCFLGTCANMYWTLYHPILRVNKRSTYLDLHLVTTTSATVNSLGRHIHRLYHQLTCTSRTRVILVIVD